MEFVWDTGKRFCQSTRSFRFITDALSRYAVLFDSNWYSRKFCPRKYSETCHWKSRKKSRDDSNTEICKESVNHEFFRSSRRNVLTNLNCTSRNFNLTNSHIFNVFMLEDKIQDPSKSLFQLSLGGNVMVQRSGDVRFGRLEIIALKSGFCSFPQFDMLNAKFASVLNKIIQNSHFKKKISLEEQKAQKEDRFLRGRRIAYTI